MNTLPYLQPIKSNLSGDEIIDSLRKGHVVRREAWIDGVYIRICNEQGFDENGNAIVDPNIPMYTDCTNGYFLHLAYSTQPLKGTTYRRESRGSEGVGMLFENDWIDCGFVDKKTWNSTIREYKDAVRHNIINYVQES